MIFLKKILFLLTLLIIPFKISALSASSAILIDQDSGRVLFAQNAYEKKLIASTTKIMTALVAIENGALDKKVTVDEEVLKAYGSAIYIEVGEEITLRDLLYGLMLRSGNDAAIVIANSVCKNQEEFVKLMNKKAVDIGMKNTIFLNPHGLEENDGNGNMSTAYDMAILMKEAMNNKTFKEITATKSHTVKTNKKTYVWKNKNKLLNTYEYTTGGKTGFTEKARRTLVTSANKNNKKLIVVTLNDPNDWADHKNLYEEYFKKYNLVKVIDHNTYKIKDKEYKNKELYIKKDINVLLTKEEEKNIKIKININKKDRFSNDNIIGTLIVSLNDKELVKENIYLKEKNSTIKKQSWLSKIISWFS